MQSYQTIHGIAAFVFGILFDFRKRAYMIWIYSFMFIILAFSPFLLYFPDHEQIFGFVLWSWGGLSCVLYLLPFIEIAPQTSFPELWASGGAIVRYIVSGLVIIPTALLTEFVSNDLIVVINVIITALLIKTVSFNRYETAPIRSGGNEEYSTRGGNNSNLNDNSEAAFPKPSVENSSALASDGNQLLHIKKFAKKYGLNSSEAGALQNIISSEESIKAISKKENVSARTFQRYLSKLYEKTGTKTRAGLVSAYHKEFQSTPAYSDETLHN
jgi:DNA-binding CsgD family transcriptional regulator